jgi:hypothetical protein
MKQHLRILRSIPGVGPVICAALIGEMPELGTISRELGAIQTKFDKENVRMSLDLTRFFWQNHLLKTRIVSIAHPFQTHK